MPAPSSQFDPESIFEETPASDTNPHGYDQTLIEAVKVPLPSTEEAFEEVLRHSRSRSCIEAIELAGRFFAAITDARSDTKPKFDPLGTPHIITGRPKQYGEVLYVPRERDGTLYVIGDIHGDMEVVETIFRRHNLFTRMCLADPKDHVSIVLLGDIVDGDGGRSTECLEFLYDLKLNHGLWDSIHILAGNHERYPDSIQRDEPISEFCAEVLRDRASYAEIGDQSSDLIPFMERWHELHHPDDPIVGSRLHMALARLFYAGFRELPSIALIGDLCLTHAGVTDKGPFAAISKSRLSGRLPSFREGVEWLVNARNDPFTTDDLLWSDYDPIEKATRPNEKRKRGLIYGPDALSAFLEILGARMMIRGHQLRPPAQVDYLNGAVWSHNKNVVTVNSTQRKQYLEIDLSRTAEGLGAMNVLQV